eukprot:403346535
MVYKKLACLTTVFALSLSCSSAASIDSFDNDCLGCLSDRFGYFCVSGSIYANDCDSTSYSSITCNNQYSGYQDINKCIESYNEFTVDLTKYINSQTMIISGNIQFTCTQGLPSSCTFVLKKGSKIHVIIQNPSTTNYDLTFLNNAATNTYRVNNDILYNSDTFSLKVSNTPSGYGYHFLVSALQDSSAPLFRISASSTTTTTTPSGPTSTPSPGTTNTTTSTPANTQITSTATTTITVTTSTQSSTTSSSLNLFFNGVAILLAAFITL